MNWLIIYLVAVIFMTAIDVYANGMRSANFIGKTRDVIYIGTLWALFLPLVGVMIVVHFFIALTGIGKDLRRARH